MGGVVDFVNFRAYDNNEIKERLEKADLIYIVGGRQHLLEKLFRETNTINIIKDLAKTKVIMGTSAGSICLGRKITSQKFWDERYPTDKEIARTHEELNLVNFNIIPNYMREDHKKWTKEFFERVLSDNEFPVYAIKDSEAVIYNEGKIEFIGGAPDVFGKVIEKGKIISKKPTINIRKAALSDLKEIQNLNNELFKKEFNDYDKSLKIDWPYQKEGEQYFKNVINKNYLSVAVDDNNNIIGYIAGSLNVQGTYNTTKIAELDNMFIKEEYRGYGIGSKLVSKFKKYCQENGVSIIRVTAYFKNKEAIKFYIKNNFNEFELTLKFEQ